MDCDIQEMERVITCNTVIFLSLLCFIIIGNDDPNLLFGGNDNTRLEKSIVTYYELEKSLVTKKKVIRYL